MEDFNDAFAQVVFKENATQGELNEDVLCMYNTYAGSYDQDTQREHFTSAETTAEYFHKHAQRLSIGKDCLVLDVAAGTGNVAYELKQKYGYRNVHAVDASMAMLDKAKERNIYTELSCCLLGGDHKVPAADNTYDGAVISGGVLKGHLTHDAFPELIRVVRPGGIIVNCMREEFTWNDPEFPIRQPFARLEVEGRWAVVEIAVPTRKYYKNKYDALVHVYKVL